LRLAAAFLPAPLHAHLRVEALGPEYPALLAAPVRPPCPSASADHSRTAVLTPSTSTATRSPTSAYRPASAVSIGHPRSFPHAAACGKDLRSTQQTHGLLAAGVEGVDHGDQQVQQHLQHRVVLRVRLGPGWWVLELGSCAWDSPSGGRVTLLAERAEELQRIADAITAALAAAGNGTEPPSR